MLKKAWGLLLAGLFPLLGFCQIPNESFENWTNMGTYSNPDFWGTMNNTTSAYDVFTATQDTPGNPGATYLKLTTQTVGPNVINGIAVSGVLDTVTLLPKSGFAYTKRPRTFTGKWQHMIFGTSQGSLSAILTRWNSATGTRETIAAANKTLQGMAMSWANFSISFTYQSGQNPDTCIIVLKASGANPVQDDYLWVDNLAFNDSVAGISEINGENPAIQTFPNPANTELEFTSPTPSYKNYKLIVNDLNGNMIIEKIIISLPYKLNTTSLKNSTYIFKLESQNGEKVSCGKFTIKH